ncbi:hypothetical protein GQ600_5331 [Phytophthora cactorum]|nr:hypothetical protein GQ600_5331 [Phytophthora cactorum]
MQLEMVERELTGRSCWRRAQRIHRRRLLLELDVLYKLKRPQEEIELLTTALQVNYQDPEPAGVTTEIRKETYPTVLMPELLELDALIENRLNLLSYSTAKDSSLKGILRGLDVYGREKVFQKILTWNGSEEEHWTMLEVFLDDYPFEYADIPGYVDIIVKDVRRKRDKDPVMGCSFNFRAVHRELSFSQLLECARQDSELFRSNSEFAVRGMQLLRAAAEVDSEQSSDLRSEAQSEKELQHLATYVEFLRDFAHCRWIAGGRTLSPFGYVGSCGFDGVYQANHDDIIRKSLGTLWSSAIDEKAVFSALSNYLDTSILDVQHALTMIKCGKGMFSEWTEKLKANSQVLPSGLSAPQLVFCESNPTYFLPEDPLRVYVRTRNVKSLTAHLYEIKTMEYYSRLRREIKGDICLDGLLPTEEQVVDLSHLTQWQESRVSVEFLATRKSQRGVFVVEVFEKGMTCRAILRKGFLRHVERITTQGHEFMVLDEHGNLLRDARALVLNVKTGGSRAQHGREYTPDEKGSIIIPFRHPNEGSSSDKFAIAFCHGSFGYFHGAFSYLAESFSVDVDMHIDTEQLLPGFIAQLVTRPRLLVAGLATGEPLDLIVDLKVVIEFDLVNTSNVGSSSHKEILSFVSMQEIVNNPPCFEIPMDAQSFNVTLEGRVSQPHLDVKTGDLPKVSDSKRFEVQRVDNFDSTYAAHFVRRSLEAGNPYSPSEFRVLVLGHNGEPVPNTPADFFFKHVHHTEEIKVALQTDTSGSWELPNLRSYRPQIMNCSVEETVEIPIPFAFSSKVEAWIQDKLVSVCEVVDTVLQNAAHFSEVAVVKSKLNCPVSIGVRIAREGKYVVYLRPLNLKYPVTVCMKKNMQVNLPLGVTIQPKQVLLATPTLPLTISSQELKTEDKHKVVLEIQLRNASRTSTHVLVLLKQFLDMRSKKISEALVADGLAPVTSSGVRLPKLYFRSAPLENDFLKMRKISDEYAYILQRRALVSSGQNLLLLLGSPLLPKPSLLQNPHVISESDMEVVTVEAGDKVTGFKSVASHDIQSGGERMRMNMQMKKRASRGSSRRLELVPSISFLGKQSQLLVSSVRSGCVCTQELAMILPDRDNQLILPKRDIRLSAEEALAPSEHFQQGDSHECIRPGEVKTLPRSFSSKYALYDSLESAINLWPTLTSGSAVSELANKLKEWWSLTLHEKSSFYYANACDDFHFYLLRKDPDFFRQFAKPLIQAKISKSLVDYYVLGDESSLRRFYLGPATFQRLSCVEKLLVAERMADVEVRTLICRAVIREIDSTYPSGCSALSRLFNTVLSQGQVEPSAAPTPPIEQVSGMAFGAAPPDISSEDDVDGDGNAEEEAKQKRKKLKQDTPYIPPGKVRKVREKRFFTGQHPTLSGCNKFWKEYAEHLLRARTGAVRFVSSYFPEALVAITEGLFALAVLDLDIETKPTQVQLSSSAANSVLILKQRIQDENGDSNPELLVNKVYTTVVTLSNIGSEHLTNVNLLLQIPQGAIPMGSSGFYTKNEIGNVAPNHTSEFKFSFYFPEVGVFAQYPARASLDGVVIAWATIQEDGATCKVVHCASRVNLASWSDVSAEVRYKKSYSLWNLQNLSVGSGFCSLFVDERRLYHTERFASELERFDHSGKRILNSEARQYFGDLCQRLGTHTRMDGQHLLVMAYYMVLFDRNEDAIKIFSRLQSCSGSDDVQLKATVHYAYLAAFLDFFRSNDQQGPMFAVARQVVTSYVTYPQPRWRQRFKRIQAFLEEYDAFEKQSLRQHQGMEMIDDAMEGDQKNREAAAGTRGSQIKLEASVGEGAVVLLSQCIGQCELAFYPIDVELMFSTEPFNTFSDSAASASSILLVEPRQQLSVNLNTIPTDTSMAKTVVQIPDELNGAQMMVRIRELPSSRLVKSVAPPINIILPYFNSSLKVDIMTQCGILQVLRDSLPVRSCYVKVYAKVSSVGGRTKTEFYKDGYTDLLGKFDYVGINGDLISSVEKFSILISHDKFGARVEQAEPPVLATSIGDFTHKDEHELLLY